MSQRAPGTRRHRLALVACTGTCSVRTEEEAACQGLATMAGETTMEDKRPACGRKWEKLGWCCWCIRFWH
ncbi:hypothetical protein MTO96_049072 [Rhipicephalus appendiculatus]